ncbi:hypothetical protein C2M14_07235 [Enterobacter cloacae]|nr:hypothetical protein C2M14_07235 [Enterobacter cloacae]
MAAMKLALASLEAEPVAFRSKLQPPSAIGSERWDYTDHRQPDAFELENCVIERLYTAPPAPVSMKDHQIRELVNELRDIAVEYQGTQQLRERIARTVRAAILQGAEPVSNRDELPDGWVACSERLPEVGGMYLCYVQDEYEFDISHFCFEYLAAHKKFDSAGINITHWMPLPAAPQQKVK